MRSMKATKAMTMSMRAVVAVSLASLATLAGCDRTRARECPTLTDVSARLARDVHSHPDPRTPEEVARNWSDDAGKLQSERDALERLTYRDERLAVWASTLRDTVPIQARVARRMCDAVRAGDPKLKAELQVEWDDRQKKIAAIVRDVEAYCHDEPH
ncbi:MAG: hypothetical protein NVSMB47_15180 [Polyangiales bacterium]